MRGRPSNVIDPELASQIEAALDAHAMSLADLAKAIGSSSSTLSRAITSKRFSKKIASAAKRWLDSPTGGGEMPSIGAAEALQILQDFDRVLPAVFKALSQAANQRQPSARNLPRRE